MSNELLLIEKCKIVVWMEQCHDASIVQSLYQETFNKIPPDSSVLTKIFESFYATGSVHDNIQSSHTDSLSPVNKRFAQNESTKMPITISLKEKWKSRPNIRIRSNTITSISRGVDFVKDENINKITDSSNSLADIVNGKNILFSSIKEEIKEFTEISVHEGSSDAVIVENPREEFKCRCLQCGFLSFNEASHFNHLKVHSSSDFFECEQCSFTCNNTHALRAHKLNCRLVLKNATDLPVVPIVINERTFVAITCEECGIALSSKTALSQHQALHSPLRPFACDKCSFRFLTEKSFQMHQSNHEKIKHLECPHCNFKCNLNRSMLVHARIHSNEKPFQCKDCDYSCINISNLKLHQSIHKKDKRFSCDDCHFVTHRKGLLTSHKKMHLGYTDFAYFCQICDVRFKIARSLQYHMHRYHIKQKLLECPFCDFRQRDKILLKIHIRRHTGEKPYNCTYTECSYKASRLSSLKRHISEMHTNDSCK